ncbi:DUF3024 domain-containing protein [Algoriphagus antarcticus]|uniref:DUF3024 family protein n=1 Tax=Algoriphagus antarcticus TaxID=238540 RepID=A0A3E0DGY2_9BACT|nr:DUF3024 domain-containing protein [Algoriphagus antarcticus]REG81845.1 hypothetical protein C8N25_1241 [Algoriphagus antarcticus]
MAFPPILLRTIESSLTRWLEQNRPKEDIRDQVDLGYNIQSQDIFLNEIRPDWRKPEQKSTHPFAKIKYTKSSNEWKIYGMRGNLKWHLYDEFGSFDTLDKALDLIMKNPHGSFFG